MKILLLLLTSMMCCHHAVAQNNIDSIEADLSIIHAEDQGLRQQMLNAINAWQVEDMILYQQQIDDAEERHQRYIAELISRHKGIPAGLSDKAYSAIFLVVDHADLRYQKHYFPFLRRASSDGLISASDVATLRDRILMYSNRKQLYGTQTKARAIREGEENIVYVWPIKSPHKIEGRRAEVGLSTMQEQIAALGYQGFTVVWDTSLSVADIERLTAAGND